MLDTLTLYGDVIFWEVEVKMQGAVESQPVKRFLGYKRDIIPFKKIGYGVF